MAAGPLFMLVALAVADLAAAAEGPSHPHVVERGDTLIGLGRRYLLEPAQWPQLQRLNAVRDARRLPVGRTLQVPLNLMRSEPADARVDAVRGTVRSAGRAVVAGQALPEGSELESGPDGHVTVRLVDGTVLRLRAGGRARIDTSRRVQGTDSTRSGVRLDQGRVEVQAPPARGGRPGFRIDTPQGVLGVRGTEFRVETTASHTRGEVMEGVVAVSAAANANEQRVQAGYGTVIDASGRVAAPTALLAAPDVSTLPALHERPLVRLPMPALPGAVAWRVQVAADEHFDHLLADVRSTTAEVRLVGLPDGRYPMRLRAMDALGLEGRDAHSVLNLKARPEPPLPRAPAARAVIIGSRVDFAWAASSEAARYRLQLARDDAGASPFGATLHDVTGLDATTLVLDALSPGLYLWRLGSLRADGDAGPFGDPQAFELRAAPPPVAPRTAPSAPSAPAVGDGSMRVFWQGQPGQRFDVQLAADAAFLQLVEERQVDRPEVELAWPGPGRFHLRLRVREADGFVGPWSAGQHIDVVACVRDSRADCVRVESGPLQSP